jgi:hypothetical protein
MVDTDLTSDHPISDDQELAKALAGVGNQVDPSVSQQEYQPEQDGQQPTADNNYSMQESNESDDEKQPDEKSAEEAPNDLGIIKNEAINDLRPLVGKLNISAEDKFDTYLLLIRSTDDKSLVGPAYETAKSIEDEAHRAQALLEIIKEIDYFSNNQAS